MARKLCLLVIFENYQYKLQTFNVVIWIQKRKHKFLKNIWQFELNMLVYNAFYDLA